ncbi:MAG: lysophospholipid acyltransferase family protein [Daejeonella sp.]|uniref:lysophospholipid acyltransferase family protein n=1 Tax=Daejeonella sp. TaxID=2805397 RepID=UPI003C757B06
MTGIQKAFSMLFVVWCFLVFISAMLLVMPFILIISAFSRDKRGSDYIFFFLKFWGWLFCLLGFFQIRTQNKITLQSNKAYIYVCNHNSYLDAIAVVLAIPNSFRPLGKVEMVKVPLFGIIYSKVVVLIDRASKESRAQSVEELKQDLAKGQSILIFPEGTMNQGYKPLSDFYDGAFRLAIETQTSIAPMVLINARNLFPRADPFRAKPGTITCIFDEPINVTGMRPEDLETLKSQVYSKMEAMIKRYS